MNGQLSPLARGLGALSAEGLGWCVGFNLAPLRRIAEPPILAAMFHLDAPPPVACVAALDVFADPAVPAGVPSGGDRHGTAAAYVARHLVPLVEQRMATAPEAFRTGSTGCC